jgi:hypothetical protein
MKVVYGNPKTAMSIGVALLGDKPTPFFGFVDRDKVKGQKNFSEGPDGIAAIEAAGGIIVYIENPDAFERFAEHLSLLFHAVAKTPWHNIREVEAGLQ